MRKSDQNQPTPTDHVAASTSKNTIQVGIDWADKEHAYSALLPSGKIKTGSFKQNRTDIDEWIAELSSIAWLALIGIAGNNILDVLNDLFHRDRKDTALSIVESFLPR